MPTVPKRSTNEDILNEFNVWMRSQPWYQQFFKQRGLDPNRVSLSRNEQGLLEQLMRFNGVGLPDGMHIDQAGNVNQKNRLLRNVGIGAGVAGGALAGLGFAGLGPFSGLGGSAAAAPAATAKAGMSLGPTAVPTSVGAGSALPTIASRDLSHSLTSGAMGGLPTIPSRELSSVSRGPSSVPTSIGGGDPGSRLAAVGNALKSLGSSNLLGSLLKYAAPAAAGFGLGRMSGGGSEPMPAPPSYSVRDMLNDLPELEEMMKLQADQARLQNMQGRRADPLLESAQQLAMNLLPRTAFGPLTEDRKLGR